MLVFCDLLTECWNSVAQLLPQSNVCWCENSDCSLSRTDVTAHHSCHTF